MRYYPISRDQAARINYDEMVRQCGHDAAESLDFTYLYFEIDKEEMEEMAKASWPALTKIEEHEWPREWGEFPVDKNLFICEEGGFVVDDKEEAEARWKSAWLEGFTSERAEKITREMLKNAGEDMEKTESRQWAHLTVLPHTGHADEHFIEGCRLDDEKWVWRLNTPMGDSEWQIGCEEDILISVEENCRNWHLE